MDLKSFLVETLEKTPQMLKMTVADMTDEELRERPVEMSNPANWQIGHVISAEAHLFAACGMPRVEMPATFDEVYGGGKPPKPGETRNYLSKAELLGLADRVNNAAVAWLKTQTAEQLSAPGPEKYRAFMPTVADVVTLMPSHFSMHVGQIQVLRRRLGKPVLF